MAKDIIINLKLDDKEITAKITNADTLVNELRKSAKSTTETFKDWATITTGLNQGLQLARDVIGQIGGSVMKGAKLDVLRANFQGTTEDIELFRKATSQTVTEANLIKLSNQATDLGISLKDQALLFNLADDAADKYGTSVEEGFSQVVLATEGNIRGLKAIGIQKAAYEQTVQDMARAHGDEIAKLDAETQKQIRLQAVLKLTGVSIDDVKNKVQDNADKLEEMGVKIEEAETAMGSWISNTIVPFIDSTGTAGTSVLAIGSAATTIIPMLGSLRLALQGVNKSALGMASLVVSIGALLGVGAGKLIDYLKYDLPEQINEESKKAADELNKAPDFLSGNKRFVPGTGVVTITQEPPLSTTPTTPGFIPKTGPKKETLQPGELPMPIADEEIMAMLDENMLQLDEYYNQEIERMAELNDLKWQYFEDDQLMAEEQKFNDEMIYYSTEELLNREIELEQQRYAMMDKLRTAETQDEFENLKKQKQVIDRRIDNIKREVQAREEFTKQGILAGVQMYDSARSLGEQLKQVARESIKRIIAEAVATQLAKVIAMIPWPFNLIAAPAAGLAVSALFEKIIPPFATGGMINGKRHSSGGTLINAEGGEFIVNRESTRNNIELLEAINSGRDVALSGGSSVEVIRAINNLGSDIRQLQLIAKINPREFDEGYSDYLLKKNHTG